MDNLPRQEKQHLKSFIEQDKRFLNKDPRTVAAILALLASGDREDPTNTVLRESTRFEDIDDLMSAYGKYYEQLPEHERIDQEAWMRGLNAAIQKNPELHKVKELIERSPRLMARVQYSADSIKLIDHESGETFKFDLTNLVPKDTQNYSSESVGICHGTGDEDLPRDEWYFDYRSLLDEIQDHPDKRLPTVEDYKKCIALMPYGVELATVLGARFSGAFVNALNPGQTHSSGSYGFLRTASEEMVLWLDNGLETTYLKRDYPDYMMPVRCIQAG